MDNDWISAEEICTYYHVEQAFILDLYESELIRLKRMEQKLYLPIEEIRNFEKMRRLHYEMKINMEGLEAVQNLLETVRNLQNENKGLRKRLELYE